MVHRFRSNLLACLALTCLGSAMLVVAPPPALAMAPPPPLTVTWEPGRLSAPSFARAILPLDIAAGPSQPPRRAGRTAAALSRRYTP